MSNREKLIEELNSAGRYFSTVSTLFHHAIAEKAGLSGADHKYLDLLFQEGSMTAGKFAELTGLTTGAVTGIIDRLEKKGLVKRISDPDDRRKVLLVGNIENAMKLFSPFFKQLQTDLNLIYDDYTDEELKTIHNYLTGTIEYFRNKTNQLRESNL